MNETNKQTKAYIIAGVALLVLIIGVTLFLVLYKKPSTQPIDISSTTNGEVIVPVTQEEVIKNILVAGVDNFSNDTDVLMIVSLNMTQKKVNIISLPRDIYVNQAKVGFGVTKLGKLYGAVAGRASSKDAMGILSSQISSSLNITIDDFVLVDLKVFRDVIDRIGGVTFDVPSDMVYVDPYQNLNIDLKKGTQTLTGAQAEMLIRYKQTYTNDDLGRINVTQQFLAQVYEKAMKMNITELVALGIETLNNVKATSITINSVATYVSNAYECKANGINTLTIPGEMTKNESGEVLYVVNKNNAKKCVNDYLDPKHSTTEFDKELIFTTTEESYITVLYSK